MVDKFRPLVPESFYPKDLAKAAKVRCIWSVTFASTRPLGTRLAPLGVKAMCVPSPEREPWSTDNGTPCLSTLLLARKPLASIRQKARSMMHTLDDTLLDDPCLPA